MKNIIIVTGGAGHLGSAISESLAELGSDIIVIGRDVEKGEKFAQQLSSDFDVNANGWVQLATKQYVTSIGNGSATSYTVTHNLNSKDVIVQLYDVSSFETVIADVVRTSVDVVTVDFSVAPTTNDIRVLVQKIG